MSKPQTKKTAVTTKTTVATQTKAPVKRAVAQKKAPAAGVRTGATSVPVRKKSDSKRAAGSSAVHVPPRKVCAPCIFQASEDKAFWVNNGPIISTLDGLRDALRAMSDEQFEYHTKRAGNDFARWVDEVLCHGACAEKLARVKTRTGAVKAIASCNCG